MTLTNGGGKMERTRLRRCVGVKLADLNLILGELTREKKIGITGKKVSLILEPYYHFVNDPLKLILKLTFLAGWIKLSRKGRSSKYVHLVKAGHTESLSRSWRALKRSTFA